MVGYQADVQKFWWFTLIIMLMDNAGSALGIFVSWCVRGLKALGF